MLGRARHSARSAWLVDFMQLFKVVLSDFFLYLPLLQFDTKLGKVLAVTLVLVIAHFNLINYFRIYLFGNFLRFGQRIHSELLVKVFWNRGDIEAFFLLSISPETIKLCLMLTSQLRCSHNYSSWLIIFHNLKVKRKIILVLLDYAQGLFSFLRKLQVISHSLKFFFTSNLVC